mmetsp:Transcript_59973/g.106341  ORF Transcript_59973/g.106341 Transcript_59973/m.106341 type:complete len:487 (+) Transcript_59973:64-1524(+)
MESHKKSAIKVKIGDIIEQLDLTAHQWHTIFFTWWIWICIGWVLTSAVYMMDAAGEVSSAWITLTSPSDRLTVQDKSLAVLAGGAIAVVASPIFGSFGDVLGRVITTKICIAASTVVMIGFGLARSKLMLLVIFCLNPATAAISITQSLLTEWLPVRWRGMFTVSLHVLWNVGRLAVTVLWAALPPKNHWMTFFLVASVPGLMLATYICLRGWRYESPRWLAVRGDLVGCVTVLKLMATSSAGNAAMPAGWDEPGNLQVEDDSGMAVQAHKESTRQQLAELMQPEKLWLVALLGITSLSINWASTSIFFWVMEYFKTVGLRAAIVPTMVVAPLGKIASNALIIVGGPGACLIDCCTRVPLMQVGYFGFGICLALLCVTRSVIAVTLLMFFAMVFEELVWTSGSIYMTELFPTTIRNTALGIIAAVGSVGAILGVALYGIGTEMWVYLPMVVMVCFLFFGGAVCFLFSEDRRQKTLSDTIGYGACKA